MLQLTILRTQKGIKGNYDYPDVFKTSKNDKELAQGYSARLTQMIKQIEILKASNNITSQVVKIEEKTANINSIVNNDKDVQNYKTLYNDTKKSYDDLKNKMQSLMQEWERLNKEKKDANSILAECLMKANTKLILEKEKINSLKKRGIKKTT